MFKQTEPALTPECFSDMLRTRWNLLPVQMHRLKGTHPKAVDVAMASFSISDLGQATQLGHKLNAYMQLDIAPARSNGYVYGFDTAIIRLFLDHDISLLVEPVLGTKKEAPLTGVTLEARGNQFEPFWTISTHGGILDGRYSRSDFPLFHLVDQQPGHSFTAVLIVHPHDASLKRANGKPLPSPAKKAIIEILMRKKIDDLDLTGGLKLSIQRLTVEGMP